MTGHCNDGTYVLDGVAPIPLNPFECMRCFTVEGETQVFIPTDLLGYWR